jgi:hypothetical protein
MPAAATDKFKKSYSFLSKTLASSIGSGDTTIALNNATNIPTDTAVDCIIDRVDSNGVATASLREIVTGVVSGTSLISVTRGQMGTTAQAHSSGAVVEFTVSAQTHNDMVGGIVIDHTQSGSHKQLTDANGNEWLKLGTTSSAVNELTITNAATGNNPALSATGDDSNIGMTLSPKGTGAVKVTGRADPWVSGLTAPSTVTALGNRAYSVVVNSTDLTGFLSAGTRLKFTRTVAAPTQCTSLNGTSQYYSKSSPAGTTFTDDPTFSAWVKLTSYAAGSIISRYNGTSGFDFGVDSTGRLYAVGFNGGAANFSQILSYVSLPLNRWVHVAAELDMSAFTNTATTSYLMIDGIDVPGAVSRGGTNPTALVQAGNLEIGSRNAGTQFFPGKIAQVALYNAHVTQATILASMHQTLAGTETSLISAYSFNNSVNDLNANANNLSAQASAVATNADSPFGIQADGTISSTLEYGIITAITFSTNTTITVQAPVGGAIPTSGGVSALAYSGQSAPYGMPRARGRWQVQVIIGTGSNMTTSGPTSGTWVNALGTSLVAFNLPIGDWVLGWRAPLRADKNANGEVTAEATLSSTSAAESLPVLTEGMNARATTDGTSMQGGTTIGRQTDVSVAAATPYYLNYKTSVASVTTVGFLFNAMLTQGQIIAELATL